MREFSGRTAVITGAAGGFGLEFAKRAALLGIRVVLADVEASALQRAHSLVDALGAPVSGAEVAPSAADGSPDWSRAVRTDPRGGFELRGVPAGDVWPWARHPAAGEAHARWPTRVRTGEETPGVVLRLPERFDETRGDARLAAEREPRR